MKKMEQLYEGKAKRVFLTEDPEVVIVSYKDDATAFNGEKKGTISGKGVVNNRMTNHVFKMMEKEGIPTHLVEELNDRETAVKKVEIVKDGMKEELDDLQEQLGIPVVFIDLQCESGRRCGNSGSRAARGCACSKSCGIYRDAGSSQLEEI